MSGTDGQTNVRWFAELGLGDLDQVGGKNSSLGEMISSLSGLGVRVPDGFATTSAKSASSTVTPYSWAISLVRSTGKP